MEFNLIKCRCYIELLCACSDGYERSRHSDFLRPELLYFTGLLVLMELKCEFKDGLYYGRY
jgi:hypothetical protein